MAPVAIECFRTEVLTAEIVEECPDLIVDVRLLAIPEIRDDRRNAATVRNRLRRRARFALSLCGLLAFGFLAASLVVMSLPPQATGGLPGFRYPFAVETVDGKLLVAEDYGPLVAGDRIVAVFKSPVEWLKSMPPSRPAASGPFTLLSIERDGVVFDTRIKNAAAMVRGEVRPHYRGTVEDLAHRATHSLGDMSKEEAGRIRKELIRQRAAQFARTERLQ